VLVSSFSKKSKIYYVVLETDSCDGQMILPSGPTTTSDKIRRAFVPEKFFKMVGPKIGKEKTVTDYKCQLGCKGEKAIISMSNNSVHNLKRHITVSSLRCDEVFIHISFDTSIFVHRHGTQVNCLNSLQPEGVTRFKQRRRMIPMYINSNQLSIKDSSI
jgi:hypothetical protein